jgi:hypothetical protein
MFAARPLVAVTVAVLVTAAAAAAAKPDRAAPSVPGSITLAAATGSVELDWAASSDNVGVAAYGVYYDGRLLAQTAGTSYVVGGVPCGTTHQLGVDAADAAGNRSAQAPATVTTPQCEGGPPAVYVSPTGSDAGSCAQAAPCASFDRAYRVAEPGWRIVIGGGHYPSQTVRVDPAKLTVTQNVVFEPAPGAAVEIDGDLAMLGSHAIFRNLKLRKLVSDATPGAFATSHDVVFENLDGETFNIGPNYRITIKGGDWGPSTSCFARRSNHDPKTWCPVGSPYAATGNTDGSAENHVGPDGNILGQWPHDIVIDGARIHDQNSLDLAALHTGGLFLVSGHEITIRNTIFQKNAVYDLQVQDFSSPDCCGMTFGPPHDVVLENNWFGPPVRGLNAPGGDTANDDQAEVQLDPRNGSCWSNWLIRFNSFHNGLDFGFDGDPCFSNVRVVGNVGAAPSVRSACYGWAAGISWSYNAWVGGTCSPTDRELASLPYQGTTIGSENYHLLEGSGAVDLVPDGDADRTIAADFEGQARARGAARDAGADEAR